MRTLRHICTACLIVIACSPATPPPEDENLATFVEKFSDCARVFRIYSDNEAMFSDELAQVDLPEDWAELVDSLTAFYGGDLDFWTETFIEIADRSRR